MFQTTNQHRSTHLKNMKVSWGDYSQYMEITIKSSLNYHLFIIKSSLNHHYIPLTSGDFLSFKAWLFPMSGFRTPARWVECSHGWPSRNLRRIRWLNLLDDIYIYIIIYMVGGFNHLEIYASQWEGLSHIFWKIKNV